MLAYVGFHAALVVLLAGHLAARVAAGLLTPRQRATFDNTMLLWGCACAQGIVVATLPVLLAAWM